MSVKGNSIDLVTIMRNNESDDIVEFKKNIKVEITHGYIEEKKERQKTEIQKENEKYSFIFNKSLPLEEVVSRFITIEYDKNIPTDRVDKYMNSPLTDILN